MGKPYSQDLRNRIIDYINQGYSARAASRIFAVSASAAGPLTATYRAPNRRAVLPARSED